ncbi:DUF3501 family protein [Rhodoblastus sp.]|uniref:DUF3501 family protein n=1 Tax=Rhodoblastus sp. TaxID=1962975 RepID=UPI00261DF53F|nr:DUF3501 family protein [Rhodoblastus sp.]
MLTHDDLYSLERYHRLRPEFRAKVIAHKKLRKVELGPHASLHFEDRLTMQYQIQEMIRLERIYEPELIQEELDVYNPLIPDGANWKATLMIEYPDPEERKQALARLTGFEHAVWMQVGEFPRIAPIANEDLDRTTATKTSAVHFLRFELTPEMVAAVKAGAPIRAGVDHPNYAADVTLSLATRDSLAADLA